MKRQTALDRLRQEGDAWDFIIIGGGATGLGTAVDAAARGYRTLLVEQHDFSKGTSSRSTKLLHGGVRYLKQGDLRLVFDALRERSLVCRNAPHLARRLGFVIPAYKWHEKPFYGIGMEIYDRMAGKLSLGRSKWLSREETIRRLPTVQTKGLRGGILYWDGQFDDSRLAVNLAQTATEKGAAILNYVKAVGLLNEAGRVSGVQLQDVETGSAFEVRGKCVINATGVFCDQVRAMESADVKPILVASQGTHLILPREFLPGDDALMVPKTADGRVLFALPWHDVVVVGTTDDPVKEIPLEPRATQSEIDFLMEHAGKYLAKAPAAEDVLSVFTGLRPLVSSSGNGKKTAALSRDHTILISPAGLVTVTGGKWTTYRKMAADVLEQAEKALGWAPRPSVTRDLKLHGWREHAGDGGPLGVYGSDADGIEALARANPSWNKAIHPRLPCLAAEVVWAARHEMARTVEDILARRSRSLLLNARASMEAAPEVARILAAELGRDEAWQKEQVTAYKKVAAGYLLSAHAGLDRELVSAVSRL
jgi:glycerol-3-phosphate dehydrogenase